MTANLVQAEATRLLDASLGATTYTAPTTPMKLVLVTVIGSATAAGTEVTGGSYARQTIAMSAGANTAVITFSAMPACTVVGLEIWDSAVSPRRAWWGPLAVDKAVLAGDELRFPIGSVVATLT